MHAARVMPGSLFVYWFVARERSEQRCPCAVREGSKVHLGQFTHKVVIDPSADWATDAWGANVEERQDAARHRVGFLLFWGAMGGKRVCAVDLERLRPVAASSR